ncbi:MAG: proteasome accessory factor PafA2 family protein [Chthonomonas sp.]|nr:proteasome accessory factor PafA2 family protein [Chthonomonas sp.]
MLCGLETEYGLWIEGRGPKEQLEDAAEVVRSYPNPCFVGWDYRFEGPRSDLRGFEAEALSVDPIDAEFDEGKQLPPAKDLRSDRVLPNGARFYNDHGHPEYATAEGSLDAVMQDDLNGEQVVWQAAQAYSAQTGRRVKVYKNNTDFHGASYGTHESYLVPRSLPVESLMRAVVPILVVRQVLTGAGKVGHEHGTPCDFQLSQRAEYFSELASVDTLYRRPVFNTRDEPHADPSKWMRLHVIAGDANRMPSCSRRKMYLVGRAIQMALDGNSPEWDLASPVASFEAISKDESQKFELDLKDRVVTAAEVLASYLDDSEIGNECRSLLVDLDRDFDGFARSVDWAAKKRLVEMANSPDPRAIDLAYSDLDPEESLYQALLEADEIEDWHPNEGGQRSRAFARGIAVEKFRKDLLSVSWRSLVFRQGEVELRPDVSYPKKLSEITNVLEFIEALRGLDDA